MEQVLSFLSSAARLVIAVGLAYIAALWFALIVWTYRDIEQRSRSVITQIFATLLVVLFFVPGALLYLVLRPRDTLDEAFQRSLEEEYLLQDLEDLPRCHSCHRAIESDWVVCPSCHTELRHECPNCGHLVRVTWDICPYCATELEPAATPPEESGSIGRFVSIFKERMANAALDGKPGEPVYANPAPAQQQMPVAPVQSFPQPQQIAPPRPFLLQPNQPAQNGNVRPPGQTGQAAQNNGTQVFPAVQNGQHVPYNVEVPMDLDEMPPQRIVGTNGNGMPHVHVNSNGNSNGNGMNGNGYAVNGNGNSAYGNGNGYAPVPLPPRREAEAERPPAVPPPRR